MHNGFVLVGSCVAMLLTASFAGGCSPQRNAGSELYAANCANCHGRYADGAGPAAADVSGGTVPDLRYLAVRNGGTFPRAWVTNVIDGRSIVTAHGDRQMPIWGNVFTEQDAANGSSKAQTDAKIAALVDYLVKVQQAR